MLRQALLIGLAASGLSACAWGYDGAYGPGYTYPYGYSAPSGPGYGPILYQGTQWGSPWGSAWAAPWTSPWGTYWGNPWGSQPSAQSGSQWGYQWSSNTSSAPRQPHVTELSGPGVPMLDEWLKDTPEGRAIVTMGFRDAANGEVSEDVAQRANLWFRHYADQNRDMTLTDDEIRTSLVSAAGRYLHAPPSAPVPASTPANPG